MTKIVYTMGYSGRKMGEVEELVEEHEAVLLDIRYSPFSRNPTWSRKSFERTFERRYQHVPALGNVNYKGDGPIQIQDFDAGLEIIERSGRPVILMCACRDYTTCHRRVIAERLRARGYWVQELAR